MRKKVNGINQYTCDEAIELLNAHIRAGNTVVLETAFGPRKIQGISYPYQIEAVTGSGLDRRTFSLNNRDLDKLCREHRLIGPSDGVWG